MTDEPGSKPPQSGQFAKGVSGNPGGVSKARAALKAAMEAAGPEAMEKLLDLMRNAEERVQLGAVKLICEYAIGKPTERDDEGRVLMTPVAQALLEMARKNKDP